MGGAIKEAHLKQRGPRAHLPNPRPSLWWRFAPTPQDATCFATMPSAEIGFSEEELQRNFLFPDEIPKEQQAALTQFRALVRTALLRLKQNDEMVSRETLLRYLRGEDFDVTKTAKQICKMVDWRLLHGIDEIRDSIVSAACVDQGDAEGTHAVLGSGGGFGVGGGGGGGGGAAAAEETGGVWREGTGGDGGDTGAGGEGNPSVFSSSIAAGATTSTTTSTPPVLLPIWQKIPCHEISEYYPIRYHTHLLAADGTPLYFELTGQIDMQRLL